MVLCLLSLLPMASRAQDILIGQSADLSSLAGAQMKDFNNGVHLYLDKVNRAGGIKGRAIKIIHLDDGFSAERAEENARELIDEQKVVAMFGTRGSDPTEAVMKVAEAARVPLIAPLNGAASLRSSPVTFPLRVSYREELDLMLQHMSASPTRLALLVQRDRFGLPLADYVKAQVVQRHPNISLVKIQVFDRKVTDMRNHVEAILDSRAQAVIALCNPSTCAATSKELMQQSRRNGRTRPTLYQTSISDVYAQEKALGLEAVEGNPFSQVLPDPKSTRHALSKAFAREAEGTTIDINYRTFEGYVSARLLVAALRRASVISPKGVIDAMESMGTLDLDGLKLRYKKGHHQGSSFVELVTMDHSGQLVH